VDCGHGQDDDEVLRQVRRRDANRPDQLIQRSAPVGQQLKEATEISVASVAS
jgi:hypothetical protein